MKSRHWIIFSMVIAVCGLMFAFGALTPELLAEGHGEAGGNPLNPLEGIRADLALWTCVTFLVVLGILWKFAWTPIMEGLDKRESYVLSQRTDAEKANEDARAILAEYKAQLSQAKAEIQQMRADAALNAEKAATLLMNKTKSDIENERKAAMADIASARVQAQKELVSMSATLVVDLAGKILRKDLDVASHRKLIDQAVAKFGK